MSLGSTLSGYFKQFVAEIVGSQKLQEEGKREVQADGADVPPPSPLVDPDAAATPEERPDTTGVRDRDPLA